MLTLHAWWRSISLRWAGHAWSPDLIAGLSLAGLLLPEAVAYSSIANLPPQAGVIALFSGLICYGLIGSSRFAIVAATSSSAAVLAAASGAVAGTGDQNRIAVVMGIVILSGALFLLAGLFRLGGISHFIAKPVLRGFAFGLAIIIVLNQVANVVGVHPRHGDVVRFLVELLQRWSAWNLAAASLALASLALLALLNRIPRLPGGLIVIATGIAMGKWLSLSRYGIGLVGAIDLNFPAPALPVFSYAEWLRLGELSIALVLILYAESYGSIRTFAMKHGDVVTANKDLFALGAANLVSGLFHGMPVGAGYSATSANEAAGASSRLAGWFSATVLFVIVWTMLPLVALTPTPVLAAIVVKAVFHTLRPTVFSPYIAWRRDRVVIFAAVLGVLAFGVLDGMLAAVAVSLLMLLRQLSMSSVTVLGRLDNGHDFVSRTGHPEASPVIGVLILRPDAGLFFANAERILNEGRRLITAAGSQTHTVILSLEESPDLDSSSIEALGDFCAGLLAEKKRLLFARLKSPVEDVLLRAAFPGLNAEALRCPSVDDAVELAQKGEL
jgi:MFS superfamily sulfate permease-like transporter